MSHWLYSLRTLPSELKRRNVFRVAAVYAVVSWLIIQIATQTFPYLRIPDWAASLVIVLTILGFPVALVLAWAFEITPEGVRRDAAADPNDHAGSEPPRAGDTPTPDVLDPASPSTPFLGRERELAELRDLLESPTGRLVTIGGPGGAGKSRLSLQLAVSQGPRFRQGARFVPLAALASPDALVSTIAERVGLSISPREDAKRQLLGFLSEKRMLLVLDNFEQLTEGATLLAEIVAAAPGVRIVVTSRERLNLQAEIFYPLQGLPFPPPGEREHAEEFEAVQLFLATARRVNAGFSPQADDWASIARICARAEGLPLAIELAASWAALISCREIEAEIERSHDFLSTTQRDVPERHRSLRAVFESSWRLLPDAERRTYRRLSLLRGGFSREAAERIAQASLPVLSSLLDRSLLRRSGAGRYEMLEVLRQYAAEKLAEDPAEVQWTTRAYVSFFAGLLSAVGDRLEGPESQEVLDRIAPDGENIRQAWALAVESGDTDAINKLYAAVFTLFDTRGWVREGEQLFSGAVAALEGAKGDLPGDEAARGVLLAKLLVRQGAFSYHLALNQQAKDLLQRGVAHLRQVRDLAEIAFALYRLGQVAFSQGEYAEARRLHEECILIHRQTGNRKEVARSLVNLGNIALAGGSYEEAERLYLDSLLILREVNDEIGAGFTLINLGILAGIKGSYAASESLLQESLSIARRAQNQRLLAQSLHNLGCVAFEVGDLPGAERHVREGIAICKELGLKRLVALSLNKLADILAAQERAADARRTRLQALRVASETGETPLILQLLVKVARDTAEQPGGRVRAVELLSIVLRHPAADREARDLATAFLDQLRAEVGPALVVPTYAPAETPALEAVVAEALRSDPSPPVAAPN